MKRRTEQLLLKVVKALVAAVGLSLALMGPLVGIAIIAFALISPQQAPLLESALLGVSFAVLGLGLGGPLAWQGIRALQGYPSAPFRPPRAWLLGLLFILAIILGQGFLSLKLAPWLTLPPFHVMAIAIPPACILAYVGRRLMLAEVRWRDVILQGAGGAFLSTTAAFILEIALGLSLALAVIVIVALTPSGRAEIETLLADNANLRKATALAERAQKNLDTAQKSLRQAEEKVKDQRIKIEQTVATLYSGNVRNPKELKDLQDEAAALKRYLEVLEERQLEAMLAVDDAAAKNQEAQKILAKYRTQAETQNARLRGERSQLTEKVAALTHQRQAAAQSIAPDDLDTYERLRKQRAGVAVAAVKDGSCTAWGV